MTPLPIDPILPDIVRSLQRERNLVIEASPGAGKTTRVPPALDTAGLGEILVLEPRRIAARMAARRVAFERGETLGDSVGYQVRFEQFGGPKTRIRFLTEGVLTRRLIGDPLLKGVGVVILDEFHERHLDTDLAFTLLRRLQATTRPDLRLAVMSATLDGASVAAKLDDCPVIRSEGRLFDLTVGYTPHSSASLDEQVAEAVASLAASAAGDLLVFLPGAAEIRRAMRTCESLASRLNLLLLPLYGDLSPEEQDRAMNPTAQRKVIFATNVAESSITIDGVRAVIDSGLARVASDSAMSGLPRVEVRRISRAAATQRAGRAGRTGPGHVIRLYTADEFHRRAERETPEILRRELSQMCLDLHASGIRDVAGLPWLDAPPEAALASAEGLLHRLGALDAAGDITAAGLDMARLPLHPRLARLVLDTGADGCLAAALLSTGERLPDSPPHTSDNDLSILMERRIDPHVRQVEQQIRRSARAGKARHSLRMGLLAAFPDRVARRRKGTDLQLANGSPAVLAKQSSIQADLLVALDTEERPDQGAPLVRMAAAIDPAWLLDLFPDQIREEDHVEWNKEAQRVERVSALYYDRIPIEESRSGEPDPDQAAALLSRQALESGIERLVEDAEAWARWLARVEFAAAQGAVSALTPEALETAIRDLAQGLRSMAQLRQASSGGGLEGAVLSKLGPNAAPSLDRTAPDRFRLPSGRYARVEYAANQPPWIASRLQDFFGLRETPRVGNGKVPVVVHLLAPNRRPVQMTSDLAGFWERLYPQVRRELSRRYPRHAWPENPYTAG